MNKDRLYVDLEGSVIRQSAQGIVKVNTSSIKHLSPTRWLEIFKFTQIDIKEHRESIQVDDIARVRLNYAEEMLSNLKLDMSNAMSSSDPDMNWGMELAKGILPTFIYWLISTYYGQLLLLVIVIYEGLKLVFTLLSILFTLSDIIRQKPNNKLEFLISSATAQRKENEANQKCFEGIQSQIISDIVDLQETVRYHSKKISTLTVATSREPHRYFNDKRYTPIGPPAHTSDSQDDEI